MDIRDVINAQELAALAHRSAMIYVELYSKRGDLASFKHAISAQKSAADMSATSRRLLNAWNRKNVEYLVELEKTFERLRQNFLIDKETYARMRKYWRNL